MYVDQTRNEWKMDFGSPMKPVQRQTADPRMVSRGYVFRRRRRGAMDAGGVMSGMESGGMYETRDTHVQ